jgi:signal peptidase I
MTPAIKPGTVMLVCKISYGLRIPGSTAYYLRWSLPQEGEVVVFYTPRGETAVKRCGPGSYDSSFYALGDNAEMSYDSRSYGPVPVDHIIGKVIGVK